MVVMVVMVMMVVVFACTDRERFAGLDFTISLKPTEEKLKKLSDRDGQVGGAALGVPFEWYENLVKMNMLA
jgi:hypothetical protein